MSNTNLLKEIEKFLKIQLLEVEGISTERISIVQNTVRFEIKDLEGNNFGMPENEGLRVRVDVTNYDGYKISSNYYRYEKGLDNLLAEEAILGPVWKNTPIRLLEDRVPEVNLRSLNFAQKGHSISTGAVREAKELNHLFKEQMFLRTSDYGKNYIDFRVLGCDEVRYADDCGFYVNAYFYRDDIYIHDRNPNYAGTLVVFFKKNTRRYGVDGAFKYAVTHEEFMKGNLFSYKEIFDAMEKGQNTDVDFRKKAR